MAQAISPINGARAPIETQFKPGHSGNAAGFSKERRYRAEMLAEMEAAEKAGGRRALRATIRNLIDRAHDAHDQFAGTYHRLIKDVIDPEENEKDGSGTVVNVVQLPAIAERSDYEAALAEAKAKLIK